MAPATGATAAGGSAATKSRTSAKVWSGVREKSGSETSCVRSGNGPVSTSLPSAR